MGCSVERHYGILSFFFDGVPDPSLLAAGKLSLEQARAAGATIYTHQPYALAMMDESKCGECHRGRRGAMLTQIDSRVCQRCHAGVADQHRLVHGPVAAGACLWCHAPHESTVKHLLRVPGPEVCTQCHGPNQIGTPRSPVHSDPSRNCLDCHSGHGGSDRYLLKQPTTPAGSGGARSP